jgi:hypothetical protein
LLFRTSNASGADAQKTSTWLALRVSSRSFTPALVFRFWISTVMPGWAASNAFLNGSVMSFENDVSTVTLPAGA